MGSRMVRSEELERLRSILGGSPAILTHRSADVDAIACAYVIYKISKHLGGNPVLVVPEGPSRHAIDLLNSYSIDLPYLTSLKEADKLILVDVASDVQLGECSDLLRSAKEVVVVDHHKVRSLSRHVLVYGGEAGSCCELAVLLARELGVDIGRDGAILAIAGILADTGRLSRLYKTTCDALSWIIGKYGLGPQDVKFVGTEELPSRIAKIKGLLRLRAYRANEHIICLTHVGAFEGAVAKTLLDAGCNVVVVLGVHEDVNELRILLRSKGVDLSEIVRKLAQEVEGKYGGHGEAAGITVEGVRVRSIEGVYNKVLRALGESLGRLERLD